MQFSRLLPSYLNVSAILGTNILLSSLLLAEPTHIDHFHFEIHELDPLVVNASLAPRSSRDMLVPASVVALDELELNLTATIGQLLDGQPGVHSSTFGAGASRPVIRGLEGNRLRIMESGVDSGDLSADSPDHAVSVEPFFIERIEVLRGASTLLYGSAAIGGVVNVIDKRIPREAPAEEARLEAMTDYQSAANGWSFAGLATVPFQQFVVSASYLDRDHGDYSIPGHSSHDQAHEDEESSGTLENSFLESEAKSAALSWFTGERTRVSLAWTAYESLYGVPGHMHHGDEAHEEDDGHDEEELHEEDEEEGTSIDLNQSTVDLEFEHTIRDSWLQAVEGRLRHVNYDHRELEGDEIGTDFDRESTEARIITTYLAGTEDQGALGLQWLSLNSKSAGEESLTPDSRTTDSALFLLQEVRFQDLRIEGGLRAEHREIDVPEGKDYRGWATSGSIGAMYQITGKWSLGALLSRAQRHPVSTELYAEGPHAATRQYEIGDSDLGIESANGIDISLHRDSKDWSVSLTAFHTAFRDFIYAAPTDEEREGLPVFQYAQIDTNFYGVEAELTWHAWHAGNAYFDVGLQIDKVKSEIKESSNHLPRMPPLRWGTHVQLGSDRWMIRSTVQHNFAQEDTAPFEEPSNAYTNWSAFLFLDLPFRTGEWHLIVSGHNLLNEEIRPHTSPLKDVAPAPGKYLRINLSVTF